MVDIPERTESHGPVFIYGVEGEQIEEENDAYNDLRYDIGELCFDLKLLNITNVYFSSIFKKLDSNIITITGLDGLFAKPSANYKNKFPFQQILRF